MITLSETEQRELEDFIRRGKTDARKVKRAYVLLKSGAGWSIRPLAQTFAVSEATVSNVRQRYRAGGIVGVLQDKVQVNRPHALSSAQEEILVAIACSPVPEGHDHWTVPMIQTQLVELGVVEHIGRGTVHQRLKKMNLSPGSANSGASPKD